jgi:regulator of RNase E activity RraB
MVTKKRKSTESLETKDSVKKMVDKFNPKTGFKVNKKLEKYPDEMVFSSFGIIYEIKGANEYLSFVYNDLVEQMSKKYEKDGIIFYYEDPQSKDDCGKTYIVDENQYSKNNKTIYSSPIFSAFMILLDCSIP